jgi:hypothetical protein
MRASSSSDGAAPVLWYDEAYELIVLWSLRSSSPPWFGLLSYEMAASACRGRLITFSSDDRAEDVLSGVPPFLALLRYWTAGVAAPAGDPFAGVLAPLLEDRVRGIVVDYVREVGMSR